MDFLTKKRIPDWTFQDEAVRKVSGAFLENPKVRALVVIPTGGGKTKTALRSVKKLIDRNFLNSDKKVLWVVHTKTLRDQANKELKSKFNINKFGFNEKFAELVDVKMVTEASQIIGGVDSGKYGLIVIDEAHHAAASSYNAFLNCNIGVLGLTATPSRTDEQVLDFDENPYSITFKELVMKGVIILPKFVKESTEISVDINNLSNTPFNQSVFEKFNTKRRNEIVARQILKVVRKEGLKKVIVFVGTRQHAKDLHSVLDKLNSSRGNIVEHVGYIYGDRDNDLGMTNKQYLEEHQNEDSSILINCRLLNEGYDDPSIDGIVMATPTKSILYYMQCVGRVVREPSDGTIVSKAVVLELVDKLPNINYRIDNRWLFAEISDYLEPQVIDKKFINRFHFGLLVDQILSEHGVIKSRYTELNISKINTDDFSLLLFNEVPQANYSSWKLLPFYGEKKRQYIWVYNYIGDNIESLRRLNHKFVMTSPAHASLEKNDIFFKSLKYQSSFMMALERAFEFKQSNNKVDCIKYYTFRKSVVTLESILDIFKLLIKKLICSKKKNYRTKIFY